MIYCCLPTGENSFLYLCSRSPKAHNPCNFTIPLLTQKLHVQNTGINMSFNFSHPGAFSFIFLLLSCHFLFTTVGNFLRFRSICWAPDGLGLKNCPYTQRPDFQPGISPFGPSPHLPRDPINGHYTQSPRLGTLPYTHRKRGLLVQEGASQELCELCHLVAVQDIARNREKR